MQPSKEELLSILKSQPYGNVEEHNFKRKYPEHYQEILKINFPEKFKFSQKLFHYLHNDPELKLGLCPVCEKRCSYLNINQGYRGHCSLKCRSNDIHIIEKQKQTCIERFGVDNVFKNQSIKENIKNHNKRTYGVDYYVQSDDFKNKSKSTCKIKYNTDYFSQSDEYKERLPEIINKSHKTCTERYNCEFFSKSDIYKQNLNLYQEKTTLKHQENYGVDRFSKTYEWKEKTISTNRKKIWSRLVFTNTNISHK